MKILEVLTYYRPHMSGLTIYVERLSRALAEMGHEVTVLTSQYDKSLPRQEMIDGATVVRVPVAFRVSKGVIMPTFGWQATKFAWNADVIHLHLPQFDAPGLAVRGRLFNKPVVLTYHCDLQMPAGAFNRVVDKVVGGMNRLAGIFSDVIVTYTRDYGENSPYLSSYIGKKLHIIPPPVELAVCTMDDVAAFRQRHGLAGKKVVGIAGRLATEKGIETLLHALPKLLEAHPNAQLLHAGPNAEVLGEDAYVAQLKPLFDQFKDHFKLLGPLTGAEFTAFYKSLDCLVIPSLNSTESFGLVQIEAMMNGVPVIASALPGVRQPVTMTGMGEVIPIGSVDGLAEALIRVLNHKASYVKDMELIGDSFSPEQNGREYIKLFEALKNGTFQPALPEPPAYEQLRAMRDDG